MPDILVHAAGLNPRQTAHEVTSEEWDKTLGINLSAPFFFIAGCYLCHEREGLG
jgi:gluconate 5-dehydrogenase